MKTDVYGYQLHTLSIAYNHKLVKRGVDIYKLHAGNPKKDVKFMFYDIYRELCKKRGMTPSGAAAKIGCNRASITFWKNSGKAPKQDLLLKIADFFGVTTDYLLTGVEKSKDAESADGLDRQLDGIDFALFGEVRDMTDAQKRDVLNFAKFIKQKGD